MSRESYELWVVSRMQYWISDSPCDSWVVVSRCESWKVCSDWVSDSPRDSWVAVSRRESLWVVVSRESYAVLDSRFRESWVVWVVSRCESLWVVKSMLCCWVSGSHESWEVCSVVVFQVLMSREKYVVLLCGVFIPVCENIFEWQNRPDIEMRKRVCIWKYKWKDKIEGRKEWRNKIDERKRMAK